MTVRFQKTPKGEVAIMPRADYEALLARLAEAEEDAGTARLIARAEEEIAAGAPVFPKSVADRVADGASPIRVFREWRGMTQVQLAAAAGLGQGYVSDLEKGRRRGTPDVLDRVATALRVPLDLLI